MVTTINGEVEAGIVFRNGIATPAWIKYNNNTIRFKKVVYRWSEKKGEENIIKFTLTDSQKIYEIAFNTKTLKCFLVAVDE